MTNYDYLTNLEKNMSSYKPAQQEKIKSGLAPLIKAREFSPSVLFSYVWHIFSRTKSVQAIDVVNCATAYGINLTNYEIDLIISLNNRMIECQISQQQ